MINYGNSFLNLFFGEFVSKYKFVVVPRPLGVPVYQYGKSACKLAPGVPGFARAKLRTFL